MYPKIIQLPKTALNLVGFIGTYFTLVHVLAHSVVMTKRLHVAICRLHGSRLRPATPEHSAYRPWERESRLRPGPYITLQSTSSSEHFEIESYTAPIDCNLIYGVTYVTNLGRHHVKKVARRLRAIDKCDDLWHRRYSCCSVNLFTPCLFIYLFFVYFIVDMCKSYVKYRMHQDRMFLSRGGFISLAYLRSMVLYRGNFIGLT